MSDMMRKEMKLSASPLAYFFTLFGLMFFLPGYPVLCGSFFSCLGLYQSFQYAREAGDMEFSVLLPVSRRDIVKGKFAFVCMIEAMSFILMLTAVLIRMTVLADAAVYRSNALMNANLFALGGALVIFGLFNSVFLGGFFKTAYGLGRPFIAFIIAGFAAIAAFEAAHHVPGLGAADAFGFDHFGLQLLLLLAGAAAFALMTLLSFKAACASFERTDL